MYYSTPVCRRMRQSIMTGHVVWQHSSANRRRIIHHQTHHDYNELVHALRTTREYACNWTLWSTVTQQWCHCKFRLVLQCTLCQLRFAQSCQGEQVSSHSISILFTAFQASHSISILFFCALYAQVRFATVLSGARTESTIHLLQFISCPIRKKRQKKKDSSVAW